MQRHSRLAAAALAGVVAVGSLAATIATSAPALADDHRGGWNDRHDARDRGGDRDHRDWDRDRFEHRDWDRDRHDGDRDRHDWDRDRHDWDRGRRDWHPGYGAYPQPVYPAYRYYVPSNGYVHVRGPGWGLGFSL